MCLSWPHHRGAMSQEHTCCMRSQSHERSRPPLFKLKFGNGWLTSKCCGSHCKKFNSGFQFQFQFQFQGFQFQFHFQFHQFQFQFQFQFRNWNWPAIPIPELNWPQPWWLIFKHAFKNENYAQVKYLAPGNFKVFDNSLVSHKIRFSE